MGNVFGSAPPSPAPAPAEGRLQHTSSLAHYDPMTEAHVVSECTPLLQGSGPEGKWEAVLDEGDRLKVWRRSHPTKPSTFEYALRGKSPHPPAVFFSTSFEDLDFRLKWDESCGDARMLSYCPNTHIETVYWVTKYPWPVAERDYVFHRIMSRNAQEGSFHGATWVGTEAPYKDERHGSWDLSRLDYDDVNAKAKQANKHRVRVTEYATTMLVLPSGDGGAIWALRVLEDPKVSFVPPQLINWAASKSLPGSANKLDKACESRMGTVA